MSKSKLVGWEDVSIEPADASEGHTYDEVWLNVMKPFLDRGSELKSFLGGGSELEYIKKRVRESLQDWDEHTEIAFGVIPNLRFDSVLATNTNEREVCLHVRFTPTKHARCNEKGVFDIDNAKFYVAATVEAVFQGQFLFSNRRKLKSLTNLDDFLALAHLKKAQLVAVLAD